MSNESTPVRSEAQSATQSAGPSVGRRIEGLSPAKRALLEQQLRARAAARPLGIPRRKTGGAPPASFGQELLWHLERSTPGLYAYNVARAVRLRGPLDAGALQRSLDALVERHEALRTTFASVDGEVVQVVDAPAPVGLEVVDLSALSGEAQREATERVIAERVRRPFDLASEHQFRVTRVVLGPDHAVLLWVSHHVALDGWSATVLLRELAALYDAAVRGDTPSLPPLEITFGDFAAWQRQWLSGERLERLLGYWRERLVGAPELLALPTDRPRPSVQSFEGGQLSCVLPPATVTRLKQLAQEHDATLYMVLVAAYVTLLHRYSGQDDIVIGSPIAARTRSETGGVVGYFANTLVHRNDLSGDPAFPEVIRRVRRTLLEALEHQDVPLEKLVVELQRDRTGHAPLFQCVLTMEDAPAPPVVAGGVAIEPMELDSSHAGAAKFDLLLLAMEQPQGIRLMLQYRSDLFEPASAARILGHLRTLIDGVLEDAECPVSALPLLSGAEEGDLARWNATHAELRDARGVHEQFEAQAARTPGAAALVCGDEKLTYAAVNARANQLARVLRARGVTPGARVGISLERSADMIVALLAVLKAGGAYVPLPPDVPAERLASQVREAEVAVVIGSTGGAPSRFAALAVDVLALDREAEGIARECADDLPSAPGDTSLDDRPAYILFTSGSTGVPKGVTVTHGNLRNYTHAICERLALSAAGPLRFATVSTLGADLGNTAIFPALTSGGVLHVVPSDVALDGPRFADAMSADPVDVLKITPSHLRALMSACGERAADVLPRRWLVTGGEALGWELARAVLDANRCRLLNHYGPTETTVGVCTFEVTRSSMAAARAAGAQTVPIGFLLANTRCHVLGAHGEPVPVGVAGELYLGGAGVAQGYVNQPALTAERFVRLKYGVKEGDGAGDNGGAAGERVYRTGDRVRYLPDGAVEFLGRTDDQVKIRGYRVELGDVEQALARHPGVAQAVVLVGGAEGEPGAGPAPGQDGGYDARLVAYVVPKSGGYAAAHAERPTAERLAAWLTDRLPEYMVPGAILILESLPLTANGKVDRKALGAMAVEGGDGGRDTASAASAAPATETEASLAAIWGEVLKKDRLGVTDNFFALGGHSLLAIRVLGKLSRQFGVRLPLRTLFDAPTVRDLARVVDGAVAGRGA